MQTKFMLFETSLIFFTDVFNKFNNQVTNFYKYVF